MNRPAPVRVVTDALVVSAVVPRGHCRLVPVLKRGLGEVSVGFRFMLALRATAPGIPARALAGWALALVGLVLFAMVVRSWLTDPRLGGRHRSEGGHTHVAQPTRRRSWARSCSRYAGTLVQAGRPM